MLGSRDVTPLPVEDGVYYRLHHPAVPLDAAHAYSTPWSGRLPVQRGFSCFGDPFSLWEYLHAMDWVPDPGDTGTLSEVDFPQRHVVMFRGVRSGTGVDGEPLVVPAPGPPCQSLSWAEFGKRLAVTDRPGQVWTIAQAMRPISAGA